MSKLIKYTDFESLKSSTTAEANVNTDTRLSEWEAFMTLLKKQLLTDKKTKIKKASNANG